MSVSTAADAGLLAESWQLALRAERKSPPTLKANSDGVRFHLAWCSERDAEPMTRAALNLWVAGLLDGGAAASTARSRQLAVRRFAAWLAEEGEIPADPFLGVKSPKLDERVIEPLSDDDLRALIRSCTPPKRAEPREAMRHRRDEAIVRVMLETGLRAGEVTGLQVPDVDLPNGLLTVRRGKGGKGRVVPIGPDASLALDRYLRLRRTHRLAETTDLWLGDRGPLSTSPGAADPARMGDPGAALPAVSGTSGRASTGPSLGEGPVLRCTGSVPGVLRDGGHGDVRRR